MAGIAYYFLLYLLVLAMLVMLFLLFKYQGISYAQSHSSPKQSHARFDSLPVLYGVLFLTHSPRKEIVPRSRGSKSDMNSGRAPGLYALHVLHL